MAPDTAAPSLRRACILDCGHMIFGNLAVGASVRCPDHKTAQTVVEIRRLGGVTDE